MIAKLARATLATAVFLGMAALFYYVHMRYLTVDVVFYSALFDAVLAAVVSGFVLFLSAAFRILTRFEKLQLFLIWIISGYALAISVPTVIDRSLSFYILEKLEQRGGGIRISAFERVFTEEYMTEHRLVDVRLTEQMESGTIRIEDGCVRLTPRGERLAGFSRFFRMHLLPKNRLLRGEYTDTLTDPFRESRKDVDYVCS